MSDGIINILKAPGMTSSNVVSDIRHILGIKKVGHTGTLDPGAVGVLPVCIGRATRLFDYMVDKEKEYVFEMTLGKRTDTLDAYGTVVAVSDKCIVDKSEVENVLNSFIGEIEQVAPMYSAVSVGGKRLYQLARSGEEVERATRKVVIKSAELLRQTDKNRFLIKVRCSKGTYIRTLCDDMGERLGTYAYVSYLARTASGMFDLSSAVTIQELSEAKENGELENLILPMDKAIEFMPEIRLDSESRAYFKLINGISINRTESDGEYRVYSEKGLVGVGVINNGELRIKTRLSGE